MQEGVICWWWWREWKMSEALTHFEEETDHVWGDISGKHNWRRVQICCAFVICKRISDWSVLFNITIFKIKITKIGISFSDEDSGYLKFSKITIWHTYIHHLFSETVCVILTDLWNYGWLYEAETLKSYMKNHIKLAKDLEQLVSQDSNFEVTVKLMLKRFFGKWYL